MTAVFADPVYVIVLGGVSLLIAALFVLRVHDQGDIIEGVAISGGH